MKKSIILFAMVVMSVFFFTACGPKAASNGNAIASFGNVASSGNVASASIAGYSTVVSWTNRICAREARVRRKK